MPTIKGPSGGFYLDVTRNRHAGMSMVQKYGRDAAVVNGVWGGILQAAVDFYWPQAATAVRIKAGGDLIDAAAGDGARSVIVEGLGPAGLHQSATIATNGAGASTSTTETFMRVNRAYVGTVGVYGAANEDDIMIEDAAGANDMIVILAGEGQTQFCATTIPVNKTGYLLGAHVDADGLKAADFRLMTREDADVVTAPMAPARLRHFWDGVLGTSEHIPNAPMLELASLTDIWLEARGGGALTEVSGEMEILLVEND